MSRISDFISKLFGMIRTIFKLSLFLIFTGAVAFGAWLSLIKVRPDELAVLEDHRRERVLAIQGEGIRFMWQGCIPVVYRVYILPLTSSQTWDASIPISSLERYEKPYFRITVPIQLSYTIVQAQVSDLNLLISGGKKLDADLRKYVLAYLSDEINSIMTHGYQREAVVSRIEPAVARVTEKLRSIYKEKGILIDGIAAVGPARLPGNDEYVRAVNELAELDRVKFENEKSLILLNQKIKEDRLWNTEQYTKLREISKIIRDNPDILKYIYIDKMSDNVKIIISSDKTGLPLSLDAGLNESGQVQSKNREIDNLR